VLRLLDFAACGLDLTFNDPDGSFPFFRVLLLLLSVYWMTVGELFNVVIAVLIVILITIIEFRGI
jgi:hypothetical protein